MQTLQLAGQGWLAAFLMTHSETYSMSLGIVGKVLFFKEIQRYMYWSLLLLIKIAVCLFLFVRGNSVLSFMGLVH
jgi:hypothetical protein